MAKDSGEEQRHGEVRREAIRILQLLSRFYSYRELEKIYGIHFQNLWKYAMLLSIPERETAEKIVSKTRELRLLEKTLREKTAESAVNGGVHVLLRDTGFLQLASYIIAQKIREKAGDVDVDYVIAVSHEDLPLATALALELEAGVCMASERARAEPKGVLASHFKSQSSGEVFSILIPRQCLEDENTVVLVEAELRDSSRAAALASMARRARSSVLAVVAVRADRQVVEELEKTVPGVRVVELYPES